MTGTPEGMATEETTISLGAAGRTAIAIPGQAEPAAGDRSAKAFLGETTPVVLIVDDEVEIRTLMAEAVQMLGYRPIVAGDGGRALALLGSERPDVVITDVCMPGIGGIELTRRIKADSRFQFLPVVIVTAAADLDGRIAGLEAGADDLFAKPVHLGELAARLRVLVDLKTAIDQLEQAEQIIVALALTIEARDPYTAGHCARLADHATRLGEALGLDGATLRALRLGGLLHDLGKVAVPDSILLKTGPLDPEERRRMRDHPVAGETLVRGLRSLDAVRPIIRHHHERMDGSGYPDGLRGDAIPLTARIMAVVDVYDALVTARPYKVPRRPHEAARILRQEAMAGAWDPGVVEAFIAVLARSGALAPAGVDLPGAYGGVA
jgi:cyclic di-GMP phosphodiesterase